MLSLRDRAAALATDIAERLADPQALPTPQTPWHRVTLSEGMPGVALLHLERGGEDALRTAQRWLSASVAAAKEVPTDPAAHAPGLYRGIPALSFTVCRTAAATGSTGGPGRAAAHLGAQVQVFAQALAAWEARRDPRRGECTTVGTYDVISGLAGLGAQLLDGLQYGVAGSREALTEVLGALVGVTRPLNLGGRELPGWWTAQSTYDYAPATPETGHANAGLAHGVPGPLALLALAWQHGVTVPGQQQAIHVFAEWLLEIGQEGEHGPWWPRTLYLAEDGTLAPSLGVAGRESWCYGSIGIARALELAGQALDVPLWRDTALRAWRGALARERRAYEGRAQAGSEPMGLADAGLCHGWSGLLQATWRMADDCADPQLRAELPWLAERVLELAAPDEPFGLLPPAPFGGLLSDPAGFLTGAAGAALALHTFATDAAPVTRWDRALLLA
ncbi:hypothetical protein P3T36_001143 [Kitasatospora sp. MAP12-15]|uniref:lanthionine synthetase C family protein n=1 Tax=unclassified Kitasatospora TaxID=2633591 RepID=UPI002475EB75|nr:lanthionine synthetase C family protein [Kitasatospora sp. MAP12-44]MDH6114792.1 hypothetical protein [Kitasatospora sp. MAP12-44]